MEGYSRFIIQEAIGRMALVSAVALVSAMALSSPTRAAPVQLSHAAKPKWLTWNASTHTAAITLIASYNSALDGYNFNGYGKGKMVITVPVGAHVKVTFKNKSSALTHSALVTPYSQRNSAGTFPLAFPGASTSDPTTGTAADVTEHFSFVASKVGTYAIVCAVPGHNAFGMWDTLKVVKSGSAKISFK